MIAFLLNSLTRYLVLFPYYLFTAHFFIQMRYFTVCKYHVLYFFSAVAIWYIVQRAKLCLDFAVTTHFLHFLGCWIFNRHIPQTLPWWILNVIGCALMTVCGEFLCMRTEMKAIPLSMVGGKVDL